jgi:hypothetical protein
VLHVAICISILTKFNTGTRDGAEGRSGRRLHYSLLVKHGIIF